jgi:uncharacterized membrane protein
MTVLIIGLLVFLGAHSVRIFADGWRTAQIARLGANRWKGLYTLLSAAGLLLIIWGFGLARVDTIILWSPPAWTRAAAALLTVVAFILLAAAYVPGNRIKAGVGHPMVASVKLWALAHLMANGRLADLVLFGAFLAWAVLDYQAARGRDRAAGIRTPAGSLTRDAIAVAAGLAAWALFAGFLHPRLSGMSLFVGA